MKTVQAIPELTFRPLTPSRWDDLEALFGKHGAAGGCWCMWWRMNQADFSANAGEKNKAAFKQIVDSNEMPGILAYDQEKPVGWVSVAPRSGFFKLERSRILKRVDEEMVWSIVCFYIARAYRRRGMMTGLIKAAVDFAANNGAKIVEAYPIQPKKDTYPAVYAYTGLASAFIQAGFEEVLRRTETRPILRYRID